MLLRLITFFQELGNLPEGFKVPADRQKPWGTSHAILVAKEKISETVWSN